MNFQKSSHKTILGHFGQVADLVTRARHLRSLEKRVRDALGAPLADHCRVAVCREGQLVMEAASTTWGSRLRMQSANLCRILQESGLEIRNIRVTIRPELSEAQTQTPPVSRPHLSESAAHSLNAAADASDDPDISAALRRLAGNTPKRDPN